MHLLFFGLLASPVFPLLSRSAPVTVAIEERHPPLATGEVVVDNVNGSIQIRKR